MNKGEEKLGANGTGTTFFPFLYPRKKVFAILVPICQGPEGLRKILPHWLLIFNLGSLYNDSSSVNVSFLSFSLPMASIHAANVASGVPFVHSTD